MKGLPVEIIDNEGNKKIVGRISLVKGGRIFYKSVVRSKHYMQVVKGYGIQKEVFDKYFTDEEGKIVIKEEDTGRILISDVSIWHEHSFTADFGFGKQVFLSERYMKEGEKKWNGTQSLLF